MRAMFRHAHAAPAHTAEQAIVCDWTVQWVSHRMNYAVQYCWDISKAEHVTFAACVYSYNINRAALRALLATQILSKLARRWVMGTIYLRQCAICFVACTKKKRVRRTLYYKRCLCIVDRMNNGSMLHKISLFHIVSRRTDPRTDERGKYDTTCFFFDSLTMCVNIAVFVCACVSQTHDSIETFAENLEHMRAGLIFI